MAYSIDSTQCLQCGACASNCPVSAIVFTGDKYIIDQDKCVSCGSCNSICPISLPQEEN